MPNRICRKHGIPCRKYRCPKCDAEYTSAWRKANPEKYRETRLRYQSRPEFKEKQRLVTRRRYWDDPQKYRDYSYNQVRSTEERYHAFLEAGEHFQWNRVMRMIAKDLDGLSLVDEFVDHEPISVSLLEAEPLSSYAIDVQTRSILDYSRF